MWGESKCKQDLICHGRQKPGSWEVQGKLDHSAAPIMCDQNWRCLSEFVRWVTTLIKDILWSKIQSCALKQRSGETAVLIDQVVLVVNAFFVTVRSWVKVHLPKQFRVAFNVTIRTLYPTLCLITRILEVTQTSQWILGEQLWRRFLMKICPSLFPNVLRSLRICSQPPRHPFRQVGGTRGRKR